ncbi:MAG TPA: hypothetical protein VMJ73_03530 [Rhizomicrobium sp.]|nr:hypothetical protein [Rhizomicrobium sp.]
MAGSGLVTRVEEMNVVVEATLKEGLEMATMQGEDIPNAGCRKRSGQQFAAINVSHRIPPSADGLGPAETEQMFSDHVSVDFIRSRINARRARPEIFLGRKTSAGDATVSVVEHAWRACRVRAGDLQKKLRDPLVQLGRREFHRRRACFVVTAETAAGEKFHLQTFECRQLDFDFGTAHFETSSKRSDLADFALHAAPCATQQGRIRVVGARKAHQVLGDCPAGVFRSYSVPGGDPDLVEQNLVELVLPVDRDERTNRDTRSVHVDKQKRDAFLRFSRRVGTHEREHSIGEMRTGRPDFSSRDDILIAVRHGTHRQRRQVGSGIGFRKALAPQIVARKDRRDVLFFLRLRTERYQQRSDTADPRGKEDRGVITRTFLFEEETKLVAPARAAMLDRPGGRYPSAAVKSAVPGAARLDLGVNAGGMSARLAKFGGEIFIQKLADLRGERFECLGRNYANCHLPGVAVPRAGTDFPAAKPEIEHQRIEDA